MQRTVDFELVIKAMPDRVFDAWTTASELETWWGDEEYYHMNRCDIDLRRGGAWSAQGVFHTNNKPFTISGEYLSIDRPFTLAFTWKQSWTPEIVTMVEFVFMRDLNGTLCRVRHVGDPNAEAAEGHRQGWEMVFGWLKKHLEPSTPVVDLPEPDLDALAAKFGITF
jgi:uncharacterized protein YndB with AHSA1/START domain